MLRVWLPLNGDLRNQGLDDVVVTATNIEWQTNGKIGQCIRLGKIDKFTIPSMVGSKQMSFSYWVRVNTATSTNWLDSITWYSTDGNSSYTSRQEFYNNSTYTSVWYKGGSMDAFSSNVVGEWNHYVFTIDYEKGESNYYINGKKHGTTHTNVDTTHYLRGDFSFGQNGLDLSENDIRIYDHCLSPLEVKHLAQGLVLHYSLSMPGGENIIKNSQLCSNRDTWISGGTPLASEFTTKEGFDCIHITGQLQKYFTLAPYYTVNTTRYLGIQANGNIYTLSFDVLFDNVVKGTTNYYATFYKSGETIDGTWRNPSIISNSGHFTSATSDNLDPVKLNGKGWQRVYITIQFGNYAWANSNYVFQLYLRDFLGDVYIKNAKVELGDHATPWLPNPADAAYTALGFNNGIEYDVSGYGNNGTRNGTFSWSSDTPRYNTSTVFNGTDNCIKFPFNDFCTNGDIFTMNIWWKKTELGSKNYETLIGGPSGFEMDTRSGSAQTLSLYMASTRGGNVYPSFNMGEWYMITLVNDGTNELYYVNGVLVKTIEKKNMPTGNYYVGAWQTEAKQNFQGNMSDFKIYKTALSAEDVYNLYAVGASLSNTGVLFSNEVSEL